MAKYTEEQLRKELSQLKKEYDKLKEEGLEQAVSEDTMFFKDLADEKDLSGLLFVFKKMKGKYGDDYLKFTEEMMRVLVSKHIPYASSKGMCVKDMMKAYATSITIAHLDSLEAKTMKKKAKLESEIKEAEEEYEALQE